MEMKRQSPVRIDGCPICTMNDLPNYIVSNDLWHCFQLHFKSCPIPGYLMFQSQRHVQGPQEFNDMEAGNLMFALRHVETILKEVTGAERIYTIMIGETGPHFHAHLIPRYSDERLADLGISKSLGIAMGVFDLFRKVMAKEHPPADKNECERVHMEMKRRLQLEPLPNTGRIMKTIANSKL